MKNKKDAYKKCNNNSSPTIVAIILLSLIGIVIFTEDITLIAKVTLRWPSDYYIQVNRGTNNNESAVKNQPIVTAIEHQSDHQYNYSDHSSTDHHHHHSVSTEDHNQASIVRDESVLSTNSGVDQAQESQTQNYEKTIVLPQEAEEEITDQSPPKRKRCNLSKGRWVFDNVTRPLYKEEECEFLTSQVTCVRNGRRDTLYQNWRWKPSDCSLPKFNAKVLLEKLRGKRLMFVGDSVNRNQWESMICLLHTVIAPGRSTWKVGAPLSVYSIQDYNATVEFYWAPFLIESNSDDPRNHSISQKIIMPDSISKHGIYWKEADFLVFNTYIWWMNSANIKVLRGSFEEKSTQYDEIERPIAYKRVLETWADWLKHNIDMRRIPVFFITMSPVHVQSAYWNNFDGIQCALEQTPIPNNFKPLDIGTDKRLLNVTKDVIKSAKVQATLIDITTLSEYRKDGHTSVYTIRQGKLLTPEQQADPANFADCLHWCLPGVPDTWNELLYAHIVSRSS